MEKKKMKKWIFRPRHESTETSNMSRDWRSITVSRTSCCLFNIMFSRSHHMCFMCFKFYIPLISIPMLLLLSFCALKVDVGWSQPFNFTRPICIRRQWSCFMRRWSSSIDKLICFSSSSCGFHRCLQSTYYESTEWLRTRDDYPRRNLKAILIVVVGIVRVM